jgi:predicted DNA-binding transcriptional regulator AlpA
VTKPATQSSPYELIGIEGDRVLTLKEFAEIARISVMTLRRLVKRQQGPPITKLSERRIGVIARYGREWLEGRTRMPDGP